ncbi:hypothetical protein ScPMuIL_012945 [Solemya velum]
MDNTRNDSGENFLQSADLHTPLYLAFRCLLLRDRELQRRKDKIAVIKGAERGPITIKPNVDVTVQGYLDKEVPYHPVCCMIHPTKGAVIPDDVDITPALVPYKYGERQKVSVQITNISTRTVTIQPKALLCELQPVTIENVQKVKNDITSAEDIAEKVSICRERLTPDEEKRAKYLLNSYQSIFSTDDSDVGHTNLVTHHIELTDERPFKQPPGKRSRSKMSLKDWKWDLAQEDAFQSLKTALTSPPILGYPDFQKPFEVHSKVQQWPTLTSPEETRKFLGPGKSNADVDGLSRLPSSPESRCEIQSQTIKALCSSAQGTPYIEAISMSIDVFSDFIEPQEDTVLDICDEQQSDPTISFWLLFVENRQCPDKKNLPFGSKHAVMFKNFRKFSLNDGILFREADIDGILCRQLVLPASQVPVVLRYSRINLIMYQILCFSAVMESIQLLSKLGLFGELSQLAKGSGATLDASGPS